MLIKATTITIIALLAFLALSRGIAKNDEMKGYSAIAPEWLDGGSMDQRLLAATFAGDSIVNECLDSALTKANSVRTSRGVSTLNVNSNL